MSVNSKESGLNIDMSVSPPLIEIEKVQKKIRSNFYLAIENSEKDKLRSRLQSYLNDLEEWNPRYDFQDWDKVERFFSFIWSELNPDLQLGIEYGLYKNVKYLFFELRHLLRCTGRIKERLYFAAWLNREAEQRKDGGTMYLAISSLVWSYTSSGYYQDLTKAYDLWQKLDLDLLAANIPIGFDRLGNNLKENLGYSLYVELVMDVCENGVRIAIRRGEIAQALLKIDRWDRKVKVLFDLDFISPRLKERFMLTLRYHKGIIYYLSHEYDEAENLFKSIICEANIIGWYRIIKGSQSWLATLAMKRHQYEKCEEILTNIVQSSSNMIDKRDVFCHLIKADLFKSQGQRAEKEACQKEAKKVCERVNENDANCDIKFCKLWS